MADYVATAHVHSSADALFAYLSDVGNLPEYFNRMTSAHSVEQGEAVEVTAKIPGGREVEGEAWFRVNKDNLSIAWGSEGESHYSGHLEVSPDHEDAASVVVTVSTEHATGDEIQHGVDETVENIKKIAEGRAGS